MRRVVVALEKVCGEGGGGCIGEGVCGEGDGGCIGEGVCGEEGGCIGEGVCGEDVVVIVLIGNTQLLLSTVV